MLGAAALLWQLLFVLGATGCLGDQSLSSSDGMPTVVATAGYPEPGNVPQVADTAATSPSLAALPVTPSPRPSLEASPTLRPLPTASVTSSPAPSPTPDPYAGLSIDDLARREYGGGQIEIVDTLEQADSFARYLITYPSDGLTIYGFMNVPNEGSNFPVAIVLHGYVDPDAYTVLPYTTRYADALAEAGYFVFHPNFRNYPPSDEGPDPFRTGYAIDVLNLIAIIRQQSQDPLGALRRADADNIHLWGHSMGGGVALRVIGVNNEPYIRGAVLYGSMSGDEQANFERIREWSNGQSGDFELAASMGVLQAIAPIYHLDRLRAAVSVHHSTIDPVVPVEWSEDLCQRLQGLETAVECFYYEGQPHTFRGGADSLFVQRVLDFFGRY